MMQQQQPPLSPPSASVSWSPLQRRLFPEEGYSLPRSYRMDDDDDGLDMMAMSWNSGDKLLGAKARAVSTVSTPTAATTNSSLSIHSIAVASAKAIASVRDQESEWQRVKDLLREHPSWMTQRVLMMALYSRPPNDVIDFMLTLQPLSAAVPKTGMTPLEVAVRHGASVEVVTMLLRACPFALLVQDPLSLAKELRPDETRLHEALSKPLSFWMAESQKTRKARDAKVATPKEESPHLDDVKVVAMTILRAQKRQMRDWELFRQETQAHKKRREARSTRKKSRTETRTRRVEHSLERLEGSVQGFCTTVHSWQSETEERLRLLEQKLEHECRRFLDDPQEGGLFSVDAQPLLRHGGEEGRDATNHVLDESALPPPPSVSRNRRNPSLRRKRFWTRL